jgi:small subunit ribosomal protein S4e
LELLRGGRSIRVALKLVTVDAVDNEFATCMGNVFTIGEGTKLWVSLPKDKLSIIEEARRRHEAQAASST